MNTLRTPQPARLIRMGILLVLLLALAGCGNLDLAFGPNLSNVSVQPERISPNADGNTDATEIRYSLARSADVSIYFENAAGERFFFRQERRRSPGNYSVLWGGVVDEPEVRQTPFGVEEILSRVLPDGLYTWTIEAVEDDGKVTRESGSITLVDADTELPELRNFAVVPQVFRPNQDGLRDDWVSISYYLTKDADTVQVYLVDPAQPGIKIPVAESPNVLRPNQAGYREYRYEGGVDLNAEPPPDGEYTIIGEARDRAGNHVRVSSTLTIQEGGKPRADIAQGEIDWEGEMNRVVSVPLGGGFCFRAVVTNEGTVPIRTTGPWPGQSYTFGQNFNTLAAQGNEAWFQQAGVWRFGINFDTTGVDFPFRWAIGRPQDLEMRLIDGVEQWYLMPGRSGEVSGCITINEKPPVGTTFWWGGLIHEFVNVANNYVDRITVNVGTP